MIKNSNEITITAVKITPTTNVEIDTKAPVINTKPEMTKDEQASFSNTVNEIKSIATTTTTLTTDTMKEIKDGLLMALEVLVRKPPDDPAVIANSINVIMNAMNAVASQSNILFYFARKI